MREAEIFTALFEQAQVRGSDLRPELLILYFPCLIEVSSHS